MEGRGLHLATIALMISGALSLLAGIGHDARAQGFLREPESRFRSFPIQPRFRAFLPPKVDLARDFPPPGNQGDQGTCSGWAVGYSLRGYYARHAGLDTTLSPSFIYNQINPKPGQCHTATYLSDALNLVQTVGAVPLASFPYDPKDCARVPDGSLVSAAQSLRIQGWMRVDSRNLDDIKGELAHGNPVVFGMGISSEALLKLRPDQVYDLRQDAADGGHAMVIAGYDEEKQAFKIFNSWGSDWADRGFGWISYASFASNDPQAYAMRVPAAEPPVIAKVEPPHPPPTIAKLEPPPPIVAKIDPLPPPPQIAKLEPAHIATPTAPVDPGQLQTLITTETQSLSCARISHASPAAGRLELAGFVGSSADKAALLEKLSQLVPRDLIADEALVVRPWPQCEALLSFAQPFAAPEGLSVRIVSARPDGVLHDGDRLVLDITTPHFPAYVYVTYLQASGDAVHLVQPQGRVLKPVAASSHLRLGEAPGPVFRISEPFGSEMIVVLAAASPLFDEARSASEIEREYLTAFRKALIYKPVGAARGRDRIVAGGAAWLTTTKAEGRP